uniref:CDK-activating kinase assembly factor MAT1 n=1 Tax=Hydatigena taeniaeformis TaxID=6205 RepID=A0A0R3WNN2_HYDTA
LEVISLNSVFCALRELCLVMEPDLQTCPSCKTSKYNNPQLRLMVNVCGHSLCENCVEVLFVRGSGLCVQCKTPIRKTNFRYQLFEDPTVQKEVDIRKKVLAEFNKREEDFENVEDYDSYLETIEDIIYNLSNDVDVDKTKKFIEQYKKDNKDIIKRNRKKQSNCAEFYERELEQERILRERRAEVQAADEVADLQRRKRLHAGRTLQGFLCGAAAVPLPEEPQPKIELHSNPPTSEHPIPSTVPPSAVLESKHRFLPPPSVALFQRSVPLSAASRWSGVPLTPASSMVDISQLLPPPPLAASSWATSVEHHSVVIPTSITRSGGQTDTVVLSRPHGVKSSSSFSSSVKATTGATRNLDEWLQPYRPELCGPHPPSPSNGPQWGALEAVYLEAVIEPTTKDVDAAADAERGDLFRESDNADEGVAGGSAGVEDGHTRRGLSHALPRGACGIPPSCYLTRALQESRCGLFI